jgi:hypothetical protein
VEGEIGRFSFTVYRAIAPTQPSELWPRQRGKAWYRTHGFKEIALIYGSSRQSYRQSSQLLKRISHQPEGTSARTLQDYSEREGDRILHQLSRQGEGILAAHQFSPVGVPIEPTAGYRTQSPQHLAAAPVEAVIVRCSQSIVAQDNRIAATALQEMRANPVGYENPQHSVNLCVDDVGVKQQQEQRPVEVAATDSPPRKYVYQTVIHIEHQQSTYILNGVGWFKLFSLLIAFLLHNDLLHHNLMFFVDGQKTLHAAIQKAFAWFLPMQLILDWYHLEEKCKQQLSMALNGRQVRNAVLERLIPLLWHGLLDSAQDYLRTLDPELIKDSAKLQQLIDYFERNRPFIPCYSVRKYLGLRNSSNIGEKANDLLVSQRQKHHGMSWSQSGSVALAAIQALAKNQEYLQWFRTGELNFKFAG